MNMPKKLGIVLIALLSVMSLESLTVAQDAENIPERLKLATSKENLLGELVVKDEDGSPNVVKYAYLSNLRVSSNPGDQVMAAASRTGLTNVQEDISKRTKNARTFSTSDPKTSITEIISGEPQYYKDPAGDWWVANYATTTLEAFKLQTQETLMEKVAGIIAGHKAAAVESTFFPDPNPETATVDGLVRAADQEAIWAAIIASAGNVSTDSASSDAINQINSHASTSDRWASLYRAILLFDTSSIADAATIDSATLSIASAAIAGNAKIDDLAISPDVALVSSTPASNTALEAGDFDSLGSTELAARISYADWSTTDGAYNTFSLNALGLANISKTGVSKFGTRNGQYDLDAIAPTWTANMASGVRGYFADQIGTSSDPKLVVTHTTSDVSADDNHAFFSSDVSLIADRYMGPQQLCLTFNRVDCEVIVPQNITVKSMSCFIQTGTNGNNVTFTLYDDGIATSIAASANGTQIATITSQSVNIAANSMITILADETAGSISGHAACTVRYVNNI